MRISFSTLGTGEIDKLRKITENMDVMKRNFYGKHNEITLKDERVVDQDII